MIIGKKILKVLRCPACINKKKRSLLKKKNNKLLICIKCKTYYPIYQGYPVLLCENEDKLNFRKAILKSKYRISDYEN